VAFAKASSHNLLQQQITRSVFSPQRFGVAGKPPLRISLNRTVAAKQQFDRQYEP